MTRAQRLPAAGVQFGPDFLHRLGRLHGRRNSGSQRLEGRGRLAIDGAGSEFVGYRRYRPGEDLRLFDWSLYSRMRQAFVRVTRREAHQTWAVLLDGSASMGIGQPGKLQLAAETAAAICSRGLGVGSRVILQCSSSAESLALTKTHQMPQCLRFLEKCVASGSKGLANLVEHPARFRQAGSVFLIGDLLDLDPADALRLARRGRQMHLIQILCADELKPQNSGAVLWQDPEGADSAGLQMTAELHSAYEERLGRHLQNWNRSCLRHRASHGVWSTRASFEDVVQGVLGS